MLNKCALSSAGQSNRLITGRSKVRILEGAPFIYHHGQMAEWLKAADCKSVLVRVRWFESISAHQLKTLYSLYINRYKVFYFIKSIIMQLAFSIYLIVKLRCVKISLTSIGCQKYDYNAKWFIHSIKAQLLCL